MKKYVSRATKWLAIITLLCTVILVAGIVLIATDSSDIALQIGLIGLGGFLTILFFYCFFAEKSRTLIIKADEIIFPRGAEKNGKTVFRKQLYALMKLDVLKADFTKVIK